MTASTLAPLTIEAAYVCRGCGTEITTPGSYRKCPVCGIVYND